MEYRDNFNVLRPIRSNSGAKVDEGQKAIQIGQNSAVIQHFPNCSQCISNLQGKLSYIH